MRIPFVFLALSLLAACSTNESAEPLAWLAGCWTDGATVERWTPAEDGYLFGSNVVLHEGKVEFFEQMRIGPGETAPAFSAYPLGNGPTVFRMLEQSENTITFVNPAHDYPQRISYSKGGRGLTATVSLIDGGKDNTWDFYRCP